MASFKLPSRFRLELAWVLQALASLSVGAVASPMLHPAPSSRAWPAIAGC